MSPTMVSRTLVDSEPIVTSLATDFATGKSLPTGICPTNAPPRDISVTAVDASALTLEAVNMDRTLVYNKRPAPAEHSTIRRRSCTFAAKTLTITARSEGSTG